MQKLHYIEHSTEANAIHSENNAIQKLHEKVETIKQKEEVDARFMNSWEEEVMAREKGRAEGKLEEKLETAARMKLQKFSTEIIAVCTGLTKEEIERLK